MAVSGGELRVLVVGGSTLERRRLEQLLGSLPGVRVVGAVAEGSEALRQAAELRPDVVLLDIDLPRLGGLGLLRLLRATTPAPVLALSGFTHRTDVFKALEMGAVDFVSRPMRTAEGEQLERYRAELREKLLAAQLARQAGEPGLAVGPRPSLVVGVGASTGGPPAVQRLLESLAEEPSLCLLVCQHMPARFTQAFAERLDRLGAFTVREAREGDELAPGHAFIAPGGHQLVLGRRAGRLVLSTPPPAERDRHAPSVDRLFVSMAEALGHHALGVVLTGMGSDGAAGARAIHQAGGEVWAESEETAVIFGMPQEAMATGAVSRVLRLGEMGPALVERARALSLQRLR